MCNSPRLVKVLCTLGPSSLNRSTIERLERRGVDLFRINLSHTPLERVAETIQLIQSFSSVPVCLDTEGAQVRTGPMNESVTLAESDHVHLTPEAGFGSAEKIPPPPASLFEELEPNQLVSLDFDGVMWLVLSAGPDGAD